MHLSTFTIIRFFLSEFSKLGKDLLQWLYKMENLLKQMRDNQQDLSSTREQRLPPQKTSSIRGDREKQQNWFRRQFSGQMRRDYDSSDDGQYATVIAAAAYAINSLEEAKLADKKKIREGSENFLTKAKGKKEEAAFGQRDTGRISRRFTRKESKEDKKYQEDASVKTSERVDQRIPETAITSEKKPEKAPSRVPTIKRTQTSAEQVDTRTRLTPPWPTAKPTLPTAGEDKWKGSSTRTGGPQSKADEWMEAEMAEIKQRYEKMNSTIQSWEDEKKKKARRRLDKKESELEQRRARALQQHRIEMRRIDQIAGGAKAQAEEKKRNELLKAKEKANKIRATGKVPPMCFCC
ncbi:hypothetical protein NE237_000856 [Protea cynaroides]|uniref:Remorin C-terminal domain-containing protein n=1 Tax=Protea cynaroides TaxID=273540 RepID=A0A9Q0QXW5_9MAGN|nr:hypothetical protein NE237_000856 [Protea cynaroides]